MAVGWLRRSADLSRRLDVSSDSASSPIGRADSAARVTHVDGPCTAGGRRCLVLLLLLLFRPVLPSHSERLSLDRRVSFRLAGDAADVDTATSRWPPGVGSEFVCLLFFRRPIDGRSRLGDGDVLR